MSKTPYILIDISSLLNDCLGNVFGEDKELTTLQMGLRAGLIFIIALVMVHIAGRRSFGMRTPFDTVVSLLLGATLSRAIVGANSLIGVLVACCVLVSLHRLMAWASVRNPAFRRLINGNSQVVYHGGIKEKQNMDDALLTDSDLQAEIRRKANVESLNDSKAAYVEANGEISVIKKDKKQSAD